MITLLLSLSLSVASLDAATSESSASASTSQPGKPAKPKKVCEKVEMSGSNVPKRVCRTVVETPKPAAEAERAGPASPTDGAAN